MCELKKTLEHLLVTVARKGHCIVAKKALILTHFAPNSKKILPFVTQSQPSVSTLKELLLKKWNLTQNQPLLRQIFKEPRRKENP